VHVRRVPQCLGQVDGVVLRIQREVSRTLLNLERSSVDESDIKPQPTARSTGARPTHGHR
jgi:hypothetical protein